MNGEAINTMKMGEDNVDLIRWLYDIVIRESVLLKFDEIGELIVVVDIAISIILLLGYMLTFEYQMGASRAMNGWFSRLGKSRNPMTTITVLCKDFWSCLYFVRSNFILFPSDLRRILVPTLVGVRNSPAPQKAC